MFPFAHIIIIQKYSNPCGSVSEVPPEHFKRITDLLTPIVSFSKFISRNVGGGSVGRAVASKEDPRFKTQPQPFPDQNHMCWVDRQV